MKFFKRYILFFIFIITLTTTSCTDKNLKIDETDKFINEDYSKLILPEDEINSILLSMYENNFELSANEQAAVDRYKGRKIKVAVPIEESFLNDINGKYLGVNLYAAQQLEKDLGLEFEYIYDTPENIAKNFKDYDICSSILDSDLIDLYNVPKRPDFGMVSNPYYSISYAAFSKTLLLTDMDIKAALITNSGLWFPYIESENIRESNAKAINYPKLVGGNSVESFMNANLPYLILPENSGVTKYGYHRMFFRNYSYEVNSSFVLSNTTFDEDFLSAVNKTITTSKEKNIVEFSERLELLKCAEGYFFTDAEKEFLERYKNTDIKTLYMPSEYPLSFYSDEKQMYLGKLVTLINRVSAVTGLNFKDVSSNTNLSVSEALSSLYNRDVDLVVGIEDAFTRSYYVKFSNRLTSDKYIYVGYVDSIKEMNDLYEYKIGAINNSAMEQHLEVYFPTKEIYKYADYDEAYLALKNHDVDFITVSQETYYYLINNYKDFDLKNIYETTMPADRKYAAPSTEDGNILISIINKVVNRADKYEIVNANYSLTEVDTVGSYKTNLLYSVFIFIVVGLLVIIIYYFYQTHQFKVKNRNIRLLNNKLNSAFKVANFGILSTRHGTDYFMLDDSIVELLGIQSEDIFILHANKCIKFDTLIDNYISQRQDENAKITFLQSVQAIKDSHKSEFQIKLSIMRNKNEDNILYFDTIITLEDKDSSNIMVILRDATKETLYEEYEKAVSARNPVNEPKSRMLINKIDLATCIGNTCAYINIDNFNQINNTYGHSKGDSTLKDIVDTLHKFSHTTDLYRMNGDEFFVILDQFNEDIAEEFISLFRQTIQFNNYELKITASIGFYTIKGDMTITNDEIVNICNFGMLEAKTGGKDRYVIIDEKMLESYRQTNKLDALLKRAIANGDIIPFFQPYFNVDTKKVVGYETLMRWKTNDGILSPFLFLSIAIKSGDIYDIDLLMFKQSAIFLKQLQEEGLADEHFVASSNFTPLTLIKVNPIDLVKMVEKIGIKPQNMTIEVTEQLFTSDKAFEHIAILKDYGFNIALDDFSVGHSSIAYLKRLSVDVLKLDKSLLDDTNNKTNLDIYKTVVSLGKSLNAKIISEGVETLAEVEVLKSTKVSIGQGYHFARPTDKDTIHEYIKQHNS